MKLSGIWNAFRQQPQPSGAGKRGDSARPAGLTDHAKPVPASPFGYKTAWFAIRSEDSRSVATALELQNVHEVNWEYGVWEAVESDDYRIFVTPPVNGWTLALGVPILYESDGPAVERAVDLSHHFGEAQLFSSMRTSGAYVWARAENGRLVRYFYEGDGERQERGARTAAEEALGVQFFDPNSPEANEPGYWERTDLVYPDEEHVLQIAAQWSVNPMTLGDLDLAPALGWLGDPSDTYPAKPQ